jgi:hypothetical protein
MKRLAYFTLCIWTFALAGCGDSEEMVRENSRSHRFGYRGDPSDTTVYRQETFETTGEVGAPPETGAVETTVAPDAAPPAPTPAPQPIKKDYPYGTPVPGKPGFVTSPHAPYSGYVDVRGFPPGTEVKDPYTGKVFLVP